MRTQVGVGAMAFERCDQCIYCVAGDAGFRNRFVQVQPIQVASTMKELIQGEDKN